MKEPDSETIFCDNCQSTFALCCLINNVILSRHGNKFHRKDC